MESKRRSLAIKDTHLFEHILKQDLSEEENTNNSNNNTNSSRCSSYSSNSSHSSDEFIENYKKGKPKQLDLFLSSLTHF